MKELKTYVKKGLFYQSVVEDGSDIIFVVDYKGEIIYHNASVEETLGHKPNSLIGKNFFDYILPESLPEFRKKYQQSTKKPYSESVEFRFHCKDGTYKYLEFNSINLKQKEDIEGLILDCRDITQRKNDAEELLRAQKTKDQFLANISHEIRTPINGIAGMATLLSQNPSGEEQITYLNAIKSAADNLKVIINDILDLASIESGKLKFERIGFNLTDVLTSLVDTFSVQAREKGIRLEMNISDASNQIMIGDPVRLNQILINLISNAIKFTHHGFIRLTCTLEKKERKKCIARFEIVDTGIGIPKDKLSTIFESFSQADASVTRKYGGTGLGLTIVKQLTELQDGKISVKSEEDKGSAFTVHIPYLIGNMDDIAEASMHAQRSQSYKNSLRNLNVLLVEDNDINRLYASSILKTWDCNLEMAENGYVALEKLKNTPFDIVLMDLQMPVMDGYEATKAIRQGDPSRSQVPIIALTANATRKDIEKCLASGMNDCIPKPFTPEDLFRVLLKHSNNKSSESSKKTIRATSSLTQSQLVDLSYLKNVSNNDPEFIREMINTFLESMPKTILEMETYSTKNDWINLGKAIHKIKPSLTMMGMPTLKALAIEMEQQCKTQTDVSTLGERTTVLTSQLNSALIELETMIP
jgi:PAS domain S-box-containing protein